MFDDDLDFGFLTGGLGDLDGDGKVDFSEYLIEEDEFETIMGAKKDDDDDNSLFDDEDDFDGDNDDFDNDFDGDNGFSHDEEDYEENDEDYDNEEDANNNNVISFDNFDISKLSLTIGANTSLNYDGKPIDEVFGNDKTAEDISPEEYKKLKNENKALKSKVTKLEKRITDLNYNIQRLEAALAAKHKVKEWDGKYYRYCKVEMDESKNPLWYRTDDITLKIGDYVFVPYGYKNEELMAKVVLVENFRSDDLPFPLEKTKFICYKCED